LRDSARVGSQKLLKAAQRGLISRSSRAEQTA
jgi:hypothetical protein